MTGQSYDAAIAAAKERYESAMADSAADVLYIAQKYGRPLQTICKEVAGAEGCQALRGRARRLADKPQRKGSDVDGAVPWTQAADKIRTARNVLKDPEAAAAILADPAVRDRFYQVADRIEAEQAPVTRVPTGVTQDHAAQILEDLYSAQRAVRRAADRSSKARLSEAHRATFAIVADRIRAGLDVLESGVDFDEELRYLLSEGV